MFLLPNVTDEPRPKAGAVRAPHEPCKPRSLALATGSDTPSLDTALYRRYSLVRSILFSFSDRRQYSASLFSSAKADPIAAPTFSSSGPLRSRLAPTRDPLLSSTLVPQRDELRPITEIPSALSDFEQRYILTFRTSKVSHDYGWRDCCPAAGVTTVVVGSDDWFGPSFSRYCILRKVSLGALTSVFSDQR